MKNDRRKKPPIDTANISAAASGRVEHGEPGTATAATTRTSIAVGSIAVGGRGPPFGPDSSRVTEVDMRPAAARRPGTATELLHRRTPAEAYVFMHKEEEK